MITWFRSAFLAVAVLAPLGPPAQAFEQEPLTMAVGNTSCAELFGPSGIATNELAVPARTGDPADGMHTDGLLTVEVQVDRGTRIEPTTLSFVVRPNPEGSIAAGEITPVRAVILSHNEGQALVYQYQGTTAGTALTRPGQNASPIIRSKFCYGGETHSFASFASFAICPLTPTEVETRCQQPSVDGFLVFHDPQNPDSVPAVCACPGVSTRLCVDASGTNQCFSPVDTVRSSAGAVLANTTESPACAVYCYSLDGVRICQEFCL